MNTLRQAVDDYLALRQAMGFKLHEESRLLPRYIDFLENQGEVFITTDLAVRWATQCRAAQPAQWAKRLRFVRVFARYRSADRSAHANSAHRAVALPCTACRTVRPQGQLINRVKVPVGVSHNAVAESNCVIVKWGGEQLEAKGQSV